jgi:succinyl-CoA synthetase beta subunit
MNIHEYQAKEILRKFNVPVPKGFVTTSAEEVETQMGQLKCVFIFRVKEYTKYKKLECLIL